MSEDLAFTRTGAIGRITFGRPHLRNALTFAMYDRLVAICAEIAGDMTMRALILTGDGDKAFAADTDPSDYNGAPSPLDARAYVDRLEAAFDALERCPVPTIAAIAGTCTGDGAILAACCDLRLGHARHSLRPARGPHARSLPVAPEHRPAGGSPRHRARQGSRLHRPPDRGRGSPNGSAC